MFVCEEWLALKTTSIPIVDLHCDKCCQVVQDALEVVEGVQRVNVVHATGIATVVFDDRVLRESILTSVIEDAGYQVKSVSGS